MHSGFSLILLALLASFTSASIIDGHPWVPAGPSDSRSPCPMLNTLANHNYINHNGKNVTFAHLNDTLGAVLGVDIPIRNLILPVFTEKLGDKFDLHDVALHGDFEHDASLVHDDVAPGEQYAPVTVNQTKVEILKTFSTNGKVFTAHDIAAIRVSIESHHNDLPEMAITGSTFEPAIVTNVLGSKQSGDWEVSVDAFLTLLGKERLPDDFVRHDVSFDEFMGLVNEITELKEEIKG